ncbi:hypothetical protein M513_00153 [Trichuris suis]|uniref:Uncharacterized protein n=1 Tax=Trichuris suis TaxID=68888 RepID=A0A085MP44_9BILA|nr:hypothetical protein M513_00153 [Trichuris suis]
MERSEPNITRKHAGDLSCLLPTGHTVVSPKRRQMQVPKFNFSLASYWTTVPEVAGTLPLSRISSSVHRTSWSPLSVLKCISAHCILQLQPQLQRTDSVLAPVRLRRITPHFRPLVRARRCLSKS